MKTVAIVQRRMTHYRVPFFEELRSALHRRGIELVVAYGEPSPSEKAKGDGGTLSWAKRLRTTYFGGEFICWQPFQGAIGESDMVIVGHENKLLANLGVQLSRSERRVGLWGHGANFQGNHASWREVFKRKVAGRADWWFGYTEASRPLIERAGFPPERITIVNNAVDSKAFAAQFAEIRESDIQRLRIKHRILGKCVGVFVGSLYSVKRIEFLAEAALAIRQRVPDFELVIAGDGPDLPVVRALAHQNTWVKYVGVAKAGEKAGLLAIARALLNPGGVGLGIIDSFVCGVPMITTNCGLHGPEIAYLESGHNGVSSQNSLAHFVQAVERVLLDDDYAAKLVKGCRVSAEKYTVEHMAQNFCEGIEQCLGLPIHRRHC